MTNAFAIRQVDNTIRGVAGGEVLFIIARAGSFKTATLQNLLKNYVNNFKYLVWTLYGKR